MMTTTTMTMTMTLVVMMIMIIIIMMICVHHTAVIVISSVGEFSVHPPLLVQYTSFI